MMRRSLPLCAVALLLGCSALQTSLLAAQLTFTRTVEVRTTTQLKPALAGARPGDDIVISPGVYPGHMYFTIVGTFEKPIRIRGIDAASAPLIRGGQVGLQLSRSHHVILQDLAFQGSTQNGISMDDGGDLTAPATNLQFIRLSISKVGAGGNEDGIKLSGLQNFRIEDCKLAGWGGGGQGIDMVGCLNGVITGCVFDGLGTSQLGVQGKGGSRDILVEKCRFVNIRERCLQMGGSTGNQFFRPSLQPFEAKDITVRDCSFCGAEASIAFVNCDGGLVERNILFRPRYWAFRILQERTEANFVPCRNVKINDNIIVWNTKEWRNVAVNIGGGTAAETFQFARNSWYCENDPKKSKPSGLPSPEVNGVYGVDPKITVGAQCQLTMGAQ